MILFYIVSGMLAITIVIAVPWFCIQTKKLKNRKKYIEKITDKRKKERTEMKYAREKKVLHKKAILILVLQIILAVLICVLYINNGNKERYKSKNDAEESLGLEEVEREYNEELSDAQLYLHFNLYDQMVENEDGIIDEDMLNMYVNNFATLYAATPYKSDLKTEVSGEIQKQEYEKQYSIFNEAVSSDITKWNSERLWAACQAGEKIADVNNTSQIIFQTAVLAEGAHEKCYLEMRTSKEGIIYLGEATKLFEDFLTFDCRDVGGKIVSQEDVVFRLGKLSYREAKNNEKFREHLLLCSYSDFKYVLDIVDDSKEEYASYLYYEAKNTIDLCGYIRNEELKIELKEYISKKWDTYEEKYSIEEWNVENKTIEELKNIREKLSN